jgi:hypothetical protein
MEKKQKKRLEGMGTPKKVKRPQRHVIGSSSTWKEDELEKFKVQVKEVAVKEMIPEKWFNFDGLDHYQSGKMSPS